MSPLHTAMLTAATGTTVLAEQPMATSTSTALAPGTALGHAGRYVVERAIGKGGFGQAYLAFDQHLQRQCVVKQLAPDLSRTGAEHRGTNFQREAELLATLNAPGHPNIPEIYEYLPEHACLVMKYIAGRDLEQQLQANGEALTISEALTIVCAVASAIVYTHSHQPQPVLHRDIKPANILVDQTGRVWVIDFGLSKPAPRFPHAADPHSLAGTLGFTPPEQWRGQAEPRSDVYALGATLHVLLTGYQPAVTYADLPAILRGKQGGFPPARSLNSAIHPQIDALITQSMAFDPRMRPTAQAFLETLEYHRIIATRCPIQTPNGTTVATNLALTTWAEQHWDAAAQWLYARLPEQIERIWGQNRLAADTRAVVAQHPGDCHAGLDAFLALLDPEGFALASPRLTTEQRVVDYGGLVVGAQAERTLTLINSGRRYIRASVQTPAWITPSKLTVVLPPDAQVSLGLVANADAMKRGGSQRGRVVLRDDSGKAFHIEVRARVSGWHSFWQRRVGGMNGSAWEHGRTRCIRSLSAHRGGVWGLAFSPDSRVLASGGWDQRVYLWQARDGIMTDCLARHSGNILRVAFSPNGRLLATASADDTIGIWRVDDGRLVRTLIGSKRYVDVVAFSPDGQLLISHSGDNTLRLWRVSDGTCLRVSPTWNDVRDVAWSPCGDVIALARDNGLIHFCLVADGTTTHEFAAHDSGVNCVGFSADGHLLVSGSDDGSVGLWQPADGSMRYPLLHAHRGEVHCLALHPAGQVLATGGLDGSIKLWHISNGTLIQTLHGHSSGVLQLAFAPNGSLLASSGGNGAVLVWQPQT